MQYNIYKVAAKRKKSQGRLQDLSPIWRKDSETASEIWSTDQSDNSKLSNCYPDRIKFKSSLILHSVRISHFFQLAFYTGLYWFIMVDKTWKTADAVLHSWCCFLSSPQREKCDARCCVFMHAQKVQYGLKSTDEKKILLSRPNIN